MAAVMAAHDGHVPGCDYYVLLLRTQYAGPVLRAPYAVHDEIN